LSSRRRHTRFSRDWSSDVCSSDLAGEPAGLFLFPEESGNRFDADELAVVWAFHIKLHATGSGGEDGVVTAQASVRAGMELGATRSEERRVGGGCGPGDMAERWQQT